MRMKQSLALVALAAMAAPVDKTDKVSTATTPAKPAEPTLEEQLAAERARVAELEVALTNTHESHEKQLTEQREQFDTLWQNREAEFRAELARVTGEAAVRPRGPRLKGEVLTLRAKHGLRYTDAKGAAQRVAGGKEFRATLEELADDGLVEGDAFDVIGG